MTTSGGGATVKVRLTVVMVRVAVLVRGKGSTGCSEPPRLRIGHGPQRRRRAAGPRMAPDLTVAICLDDGAPVRCDRVRLGPVSRRRLEDGSQAERGLRAGV